MSIFTVIAINDESKVKGLIESNYKDNHYPCKENVWFVRSNEIASEIAGKLGMDNEGRNTGVVVKNEIWYGYADVGLWDWGNKRDAKI